MTDCLDDIIELRDDDSDTLETLEESDDDLEDLQADFSQDQQRKPLTKTELELETIRGRLASRLLETAELEERSSQAETDCLQHRPAILPASLGLLKHHLMEEFATVCQNEKAWISLLCGQAKLYIQSL